VRTEANTAGQEYRKDGRHVAGQHQAAMLRWATGTAAEQEKDTRNAAAPQAETSPARQVPAPRPSPHTGETPRMQANRAAVAANDAYRAGNLDQARQLVDRAAALDPSRADLWQQHRSEITAKQLYTEAQAAHAHGDRVRAQKLVEDARQHDPRMRMLWNQQLPGTQAAERGPETQVKAGPSPAGRPSSEIPASAPVRDINHGTGPRWPDQPALRSSPRATNQAAVTGAAVRPQLRQASAAPISRDTGTSGPSALDAAKWRQRANLDQAASTTAGHRDALRRDVAPEPTAKQQPVPSPQPSASDPQPGPADRSDTGKDATPTDGKRGVWPSRQAGTNADTGDWRDTVIASERRAWQPHPIQPHNLPETPHPKDPEAGD
jgi:hypothetical protein